MANRRPRAHSPLLADETRRCSSTFPVADASKPCTGWFGDGWKWHGCHHLSGHDGLHECECNVTWRGRHHHTGMQLG